MNAQRRKEIEKACEKFNKVENKIAENRGDVADLIEEFERIRDDEQEYLDNMPENLQGSDKYSMAESSIQEIENLINGLESMISSIDDMPSSNDLLEVI